MNMQQSSADRIAKNTMILYMRVLLTMVIMLYTSRVVLNNLGVNDYGIYSVVEGVVTLFYCLNSSMISSTQRYMTFEIGRKDHFQLNKVFTSSLVIQCIISVLVVIVSETIGLWFLNNKMIIPPDRLYAARWIFHLSVLTLVWGILSIPYNSLIIAYEKMTVFAYISMSIVVLKLFVAFLLPYLSGDKLILYAWLMMSISIFNVLFYYICCRRYFKELRFKIVYLQTSLIKEMLSFASFSFLGSFSILSYTQGLNVLLNVFFGTGVNAARGIAVQVQGAIGSFSNNFQMALNPQITKSYAQKNMSYMSELLFASSKYTFFLLLFLSLPIMLETRYILVLWLKIVPDYTVVFVQIMLPIIIIMSMSKPIEIVVYSTGKIKKYQLIIGVIELSILPISYCCFKYGGKPYSAFWVNFFVLLISLFVKLYIAKFSVGISLKEYFNKVVCPIFKVLFLSFILPSLLYSVLSESIVRFLILCLVSMMSVIISVYFVGLSKKEKIFVNNKMKILQIKLFA